MTLYLDPGWVAVVVDAQPEPGCWVSYAGQGMPTGHFSKGFSSLE